jgi:plasmid stabilization system protein ParE
MTVRYDARALKDIEAIREYIARYDPIAAGRVVSRIERAIQRLGVLPLSAGRAASQELGSLPCLGSLTW